MSSRPVVSTALIATALMFLSGCASGTPTASGSADPGSTPEVGPVEEAVADGPECLIGDWYIDNAEMQGFYDAVSESLDSPITFEITGGTGLAFEATTYTYTPEFELKLAISGITGAGTITGKIFGDYSADDSTITTAYDESDVVLTVDIGGVVQDGTDLFGDILGSAPINSAPYECTASGPIIGFDTGGERHNVQLKARP